MTAGSCRTPTAVGMLVISFCFDASFQQTAFQWLSPQVCGLCEGAVHNGTAVGDFCAASAGRVEGRCCLGKRALDTNPITGLDLSNCSLKQVQDLNEAATATIIDLSANPALNMSGSVFQGFTQLQHLMLPARLACPGGNASWEKTETRGDVRLCEGQRNACDQVGHMSWDCPENSLCAPFGPGFFQCPCADGHHGYKCLREGQFPLAEVLGILAGGTVVVSILLWVTQRRKTKST
ncbi:hypothetical protein AAFF_G00293950 [Aldrovandia affinis]|uniref:EGF-like domain-containing protein n=1 Tax=Aldrovandia affinis TaxID=143900 RepID=A0AAD7R9C2_9TELE|nr:hypothetical protein AAFF_G00293950 [Aldrovandia affinis]